MKRHFGYLTLLALLAICCTKPDDSTPETEADAPVLLSTNPADGIADLTVSSLSVVFTFDQNIKCTAEGQNGVTVAGGGAIEKVNAYGTDLTVSLTGLVRGSSYTLTLPEGTVLGYKTNQKGSAAITFHFSTREPDAPLSPMEPGTDPEGWENAAACAINMGVGWNLGNTLEANSGSVDNMWIEAFTQRTPSDYETAWGQPVTPRALIHMCKEAGFGAIRVPVTWYPHMGSVTVTVSNNKGHWDRSTWTGYDIDPVWMARVKEVVNYVIEEGLYCILNVHHDTGDATTAWLKADNAVYQGVRERYMELWKQIATEFEPYGQTLVFEAFNEMLDAKGTWNYSTGSAHEVINLYNADFVATVRATGGNNVHRNLILGTYSASPLPEGLSAFRLPEDGVQGHLLAEVHSYSPYRFAFDNDNPQTVFDASCEKEVKGLVENMNQYLVGRGIPCVLGEYGCTSNRAETEMARQAACYVSAAARYNIPCFYWMVLSDGADRAVPKWSAPVLKDAIIQAYRDSKKQ